MSAQLFKGWAQGVDVNFPYECGTEPGRNTAMDVASGWYGDKQRERNRHIREAAERTLDVSFFSMNSMWNRYDGPSGVPFHHDSMWAYIAIVSFGADAEFGLYECGTSNVQLFTVGDGDMLYIPREVQFQRAHGVRSYEERWSLVLRPTDGRSCSCHGSTHEYANATMWGGHGYSLVNDDRVS